MRCAASKRILTSLKKQLITYTDAFYEPCFNLAVI